MEEYQTLETGNQEIAKERLQENLEPLMERIEEPNEDIKNTRITELNNEIEKKDKIIEDTQKELDRVRAELNMSSQSELPPSIAMEREATSKLRQEKSELEQNNKLEINEEDFVSQIEKFPMTAVQHKAELLLTKEGIKPATMMSFEVDAGKRELVEQYIESINQLGLPAKAVFENGGVDIFVGSNEEKLSALVSARKSGDDTKLGEALGIPKTAIETYTGKIEKLEPIPEEIKNSDAMIFSPSRVLSKEHWQEELKTGQERADYLKKNSPKLYEEYREWRLKAK